MTEDPAPTPMQGMHKWHAGDFAWLLTPTVSRPPVLVRVDTIRAPSEPWRRFIETNTIQVSPVATDCAGLMSDGGDPRALPLLANDIDLFRDFDDALLQRMHRCRRAIVDLTLRERGGEQGRTPAGRI